MILWSLSLLINAQKLYVRVLGFLHVLGLFECICGVVPPPAPPLAISFPVYLLTAARASCSEQLIRMF